MRRRPHPLTRGWVATTCCPTLAWPKERICCRHPARVGRQLRFERFPSSISIYIAKVQLSWGHGAKCYALGLALQVEICVQLLINLLPAPIPIPISISFPFPVPIWYSYTIAYPVLNVGAVSLSISLYLYLDADLSICIKNKSEKTNKTHTLLFFSSLFSFCCSFPLWRRSSPFVVCLCFYRRTLLCQEGAYTLWSVNKRRGKSTSVEPNPKWAAQVAAAHPRSCPVRACCNNLVAWAAK